MPHKTFTDYAAEYAFHKFYSYYDYRICMKNTLRRYATTISSKYRIQKELAFIQQTPLI
jgi:hypothetical protein